MDSTMDKLASIDNDPSTHHITDAMDATTLSNLQQSNQDQNDLDTNDIALTGANPGYADTQNSLDGTVSDDNMDDVRPMIDSNDRSSATQLELDYVHSDSNTNNNEIDTAIVDLATGDTKSSDTDQQEQINHSENDNNDTNDIQQSDAENDDEQSRWINDINDIETNKAQPDEEEIMEQDTVKEDESDSVDKLSSTLDEALEGLVENGELDAVATSSLIDSMTSGGSSSKVNDNDDNLSSSTSSLIGYHASSSQHNASSTTITTIGYENMDELAMVDFSWWLYGAVFILICLRLPYVKRYFTKKLNHQNPDAHATLPYHTIQNKELD